MTGSHTASASASSSATDDSAANAKKILLTGATGFVGHALYPALIAAGWTVVCATRNVTSARETMPERTWVELDVERPETIGAAMRGCSAALYLIHSMSIGGNYPEREAASAKNFIAAAEREGVARVVYLGGVLPAGRHHASKHLASRRRTGELLRGSTVSTIELRAAMIIGLGSASWYMVRDLAKRLPAMILPSWLRNHSYPIAIDDVLWALLSAVEDSGTGSHVYEIPGPERVTHRDVLKRVATVMGRSRPMLNVPVLTPRLSSYWIALVTRTSLTMAKELVEGVRYDLDPQEPLLWQHVEHKPMSLEAAAKLALADENNGTQAGLRAQQLGSEFRTRRDGSDNDVAS